MKVEGLAVAAAVLFSACGDRRAADASRAADSAAAARRAENAAAPAPAPDSADAMVMVLSGVEKTAGQLTPVAIISAGRLVAPPDGDDDDPATQPFTARWFRGDRRYRVFQSGAEVGTIAAGEASIMGCAGTEAIAVVDSVPDLHTESAAIATTARNIRSLSANRRVLTMDEQIVLQRLVATEVPDSVPANLRRLQQDFSAAIRLSDQPEPALFASWTASDSTHAFNLFIVAERVGAEYLTTWRRFSLAGAEEGGTLTTFMDVFDWNGDGILEFVLMNGYYESHDYSIVARDGAQWRVIYTGGGGGC